MGNINAGTATDEAYIPTVNVNFDNAAYTGNVNFNSKVSNVNLTVHNGNAILNDTVSSSRERDGT